MRIVCSPSVVAGKRLFIVKSIYGRPQLADNADVLYANIRSVASSTPTEQKRDNGGFTNPVPQIIDRVNPPASTLPAPVSVPQRNEDQSYASYLWTAGRAYLGFYKTGIKNIFANRRLAATVRHRLNATQTPQLPPSPGDDQQSSRSTPENLYSKYVLSRAEFQLLRRSRHDMVRVPIFGVLFLIFGEWLPLVALFFTALLPYTCRIPRQVESERRKLEQRREKSFRGEIDNNVPTPFVNDSKRHVTKIEELSKIQLMHISRSLGLHIRLWDLTRGFLPPVALLKWKVKRSTAYLEQDDTLLLRDGSAEQLSDEEVKIACEERGIDVLGKDVNALKHFLQQWLNIRQHHHSSLPMLLSRPGAWADICNRGTTT